LTIEFNAMAKKLPVRMNRLSFWQWAGPIVVGHFVLTFAMASGFQMAGSLDTLLVVFLAIALARRFHDIGWPVWIGPTFLIGTMVVLPLVAIGYAIATGVRSDAPLQWISQIGLVFGPLNLLLIIIAGSVPGRPEVAEASVFD
jgi:uncharacterized membrane protein YhaH (DUF805 family)